MIRFLLIFLLGGFGAIIRFALTYIITSPSVAPYVTLVINVVGSFAIGLLGRSTFDETTKLVLIVGLLGGFTTFATYAKYLAYFLEQGNAGYALAYCLLSNSLSLIAVYVGIYCSQLLFSK